MTLLLESTVGLVDLFEEDSAIDGRLIGASNLYLGFNSLVDEDKMSYGI